MLNIDAALHRGKLATDELDECAAATFDAAQKFADPARERPSGHATCRRTVI